MITCKLQGGLGNLMFQIATTYSLALDNNDECCFNFNNTHFVHQHPSIYLDNIFSKINTTPEENINNFYTEPNFSYNEIPYQENMCLTGYFQSEKYFKHNKKNILDLFDLDKCSYDTDILDGDTVSLHIRRGDYLGVQDHHPVCSLDYYKDALSEFKDNDYKFIVFSDDTDWCKQNFKEDFLFVENKEPQEDLWLMSKCNHNIIANSSFSWWGAWLNQNKSKKVIAPKKWFGKALSNYNTNDLYSKEWILK